MACHAVMLVRHRGHERRPCRNIGKLNERGTVAHGVRQIRMKRCPVWLRVLAFCLSALSSTAHSRVGTITILDGQATVIHAASRFLAVEGATLEAEDIVETSSTTSLVRLEMVGGAMLDVGPASRVMIKPVWPGSGDTVLAYVLEGWVKLTQARPSSAGKVVLASPWVDVTGLDRDVVAQVKGAEAGLFAESGVVHAVVRGQGGKAGPLMLGRGTFVARRSDGTVDATPRPAAAFIQAVPRAFMDTLPVRAALFSGKDIPLKSAPGRLTYVDTEAWLHAEPRVRSRFLTRWRPLLQDEAYRRALTAQLALHPEWRAILYPPQPINRPATATETVKP